jgi:glycosyltransferase involved in cell wall biosynthesis
LPDLHPFYRAFPHLPLVSISDAQRRPMPPVNWAGTVYHGLPRELLTFSPNAQNGYLAFLGRISPEKRPDRAIEIAARCGLPLKIAAKVDRADQEYWEDLIAPMVRAHRNVEYIGEIGEHEKSDFLGGARALLFPIDWSEPFGLVMIEAMACGTPVIAYRNGSTPEVIDHGLTGEIVESIEASVEAVERVQALDRAAVRSIFETRFTVERMARDYVDIYGSLLAQAEAPNVAKLFPSVGPLALQA